MKKYVHAYRSIQYVFGLYVVKDDLLWLHDNQTYFRTSRTFDGFVDDHMCLLSIFGDASQ